MQPWTATKRFLSELSEAFFELGRPYGSTQTNAEIAERNREALATAQRDWLAGSSGWSGTELSDTVAPIYRDEDENPDPERLLYELKTEVERVQILIHTLDRKLGLVRDTIQSEIRRLRTAANIYDRPKRPPTESTP